MNSSPDSRRRPWRSHATSVGRGPALLLGALLLFPTLGRARVVEDEAVPRGGIERLVYELEQAEQVDSETLLDALTISGPKGLEGLLDLVAGQPVEGVDPFTMDRRRTTREALTDIPNRVRAREKDATLSAHRLQVETKISLQVLARFGSAQDLAGLLALLGPDQQGRSRPTALRKEAEKTLAALLERDARAMGVLSSLFSSQNFQAKEAILRAVGRYPSERSLDFLIGQIDRERELASILLSQVGRIVDATGIQVDTHSLHFIRRELLSQDPRVLRETCQALGRIGSTEVVEDLIELLEHEDPMVSSTAHWALEHITANRISPTAHRWHRWWSREREWWQSDSGKLLEDLEHPNPGIVGAALRELSQHLLYRHEITERILPLLEDPNPSVVAQACAVLQVLRSQRAVEPLEALIARGEGPVLKHAKAALKACRPAESSS